MASRFRSPRRIEAWDRRLSAVHEAGHLVIGRKAGGLMGNAHVWRLGDASEHERSWTGTTIIYSPPPTLRGQRRLAVAGVVAEEVWRGEEFGCWMEAEEFFWEPDCMSETDWEGTGCAPGEPDKDLLDAVLVVQRALRRDGPLWPDLVMQARWLIEASRVEEWGEWFTQRREESARRRREASA